MADTHSDRDVLGGRVDYPPKCEGLCKLAGAVIDRVGGVLAGNCPGPRTTFEGEAIIEIVTSGDRVHGAGITFNTGGERVCQNPRVVKFAQRATDFTMDMGL